jgi:hypothetical protein
MYGLYVIECVDYLLYSICIRGRSDGLPWPWETWNCGGRAIPEFDRTHLGQHYSYGLQAWNVIRQNVVVRFIAIYIPVSYKSAMRCARGVVV